MCASNTFITAGNNTALVGSGSVDAAKFIARSNSLLVDTTLRTQSSELTVDKNLTLSENAQLSATEDLAMSAEKVELAGTVSVKGHVRVDSQESVAIDGTISSNSVELDSKVIVQNGDIQTSDVFDVKASAHFNQTGTGKIITGGPLKISANKLVLGEQAIPIHQPY